MFETLYKLYHTKGKTHIFVISFLVFAVLNIVENLIHYNIGRTSDQDFQFYNPTRIDWKKIIFTMIIFAILQGYFTMQFY